MVILTVGILTSKSLSNRITVTSSEHHNQHRQKATDTNLHHKEHVQSITDIQFQFAFPLLIHYNSLLAWRRKENICPT